MKVDERFLKYVSFDTMSDEDGEGVPSAKKELLLAEFLKDEMVNLGVSGVSLSDHGYVYGYIPATEGCDELPAIGLIAHMDTSPAVSGADIKPRYVDYEGGDIKLSDTEAIRAKDFPFMERFVGEKLIVTDGTTLLGADDKAGIAEIMSAAEYLLSHPEVKHGKVCLGFTPDEEIGRGPDFFDVKGFGADFGYTVDGGLLGELEYENFNAAGARIYINGVSIHPGSAKNKMKNAVLIASELISMLPAAETPAHTEGYEGFYHVDSIGGDVMKTEIRMIIRDHDREKFEKRKAFLENLVAYLNGVYGDGTLELLMRDTYYNMKEKILPCMYVIERAEKAMIDAGVTPVTSPIRGGTDGATLSFMGLPCPNLSTGGANFHGVHEFISVNAMEKMVEVLLNIVKV